MITTTLCTSYKSEIQQGIHSGDDVYKIALYVSAASLSKATTAYTSAGEVVGEGYDPGGQELEGIVFGIAGDIAYVDWTVDPVWPVSTITARGALIYNSSQGNRAVGTFDFGEDVVSVNGQFSVNLPLPAATTATVRI